jgi:hypothetical protein
MAYVQLAQAGETASAEGEPGGEAAAPAAAEDEAERAKARSKIWTPPGA